MDHHDNKLKIFTPFYLVYSSFSGFFHKEAFGQKSKIMQLVQLSLIDSKQLETQQSRRWHLFYFYRLTIASNVNQVILFTS